MSLDLLPTDIILDIMTYLECSDILHISLTKKSYNVMDNVTFWRRKYMKECGGKIEIPYKEYYRQNCNDFISDISLVSHHSSCSRNIAKNALLKCNRDVVDAIMLISLS